MTLIHGIQHLKLGKSKLPCVISQKISYVKSGALVCVAQFFCASLETSVPESRQPILHTICFNTA